MLNAIYFYLHMPVDSHNHYKIEIKNLLPVMEVNVHAKKSLKNNNG